MSRLNDPENYEGRVRYAAKVVAGGFKSLEGKNLVEEARRMRAERQAKRARQDPPA